MHLDVQFEKSCFSCQWEKNPYRTKFPWSVNILYISANHLDAFSAFATWENAIYDQFQQIPYAFEVGKINSISILYILEEFQVHQTLQVLGLVPLF